MIMLGAALFVLFVILFVYVIIDIIEKFFDYLSNNQEKITNVPLIDLILHIMLVILKYICICVGIIISFLLFLLYAKF
jgi:hypothetical protein